MELYFGGILLGAVVFLIIGIFHPLVIKAEYYWGVQSWWAFFISGLAFISISLFINEIVASGIFGILGFSCFWSIKEVFEQRKRVESGQFPKNPKRKY